MDADGNRPGLRVWCQDHRHQIHVVTIALGLLGICLVGAAGLIHGRAIGAQILLRLA